MSTRVSAGELDEVSPRMRGWLHAGAAPLSLAAGIVLIVLSPSAATRVGSAVFTATSLLNFTSSSAMHLGRWAPGLAPYIRRLDHASIFVLIAGSYTPFTLLMLTGTHRVVLLALAWAGAAVGIGSRLLWSTAPRWAYTALYLLLGWAAIVFIPDFVTFKPTAVPILMATGGLLYTLGGVVYGLRHPNPSTWFGFHELFHALTIAAFTAQYAGILVATLAVS